MRSSFHRVSVWKANMQQQQRRAEVGKVKFRCSQQRLQTDMNDFNNIKRRVLRLHSTQRAACCQLSCDCHHSKALYHLYKNTNRWWIPEVKTLKRPLDNRAEFNIHLMLSSYHPQFQIDQITRLTTVSFSIYGTRGEDTLIRLKNTRDLVRRAVSYRDFNSHISLIQ